MLKNNKTNRTIKVVEKWITKPDGVEIYTKTWKSVVRTPLATVVFLHGLGDHVNRYNHVFERFAAKGVEVFAYDQRGFGQTGARHKNLGHTGGWKVICEDITGFLVTQRRPGVPQFLFGHSMGGGLAAMYASDGQERNNIAGIILSSPFFDMAPPSKVPKPTLVLCTALSKVMPNLTITLNLDAKYISRNQSEIERYKNDPLVHSYGSLRGLGDLQSGAKSVLKEKYKNITQPIYICFGSGDGINDFKSAKELFDKIPSKNKTWKEWPEFYHEMHYEDDRYLVINDYLNWIIQTASKVDIQNAKKSRNAVSSSSPITLAC